MLKLKLQCFGHIIRRAAAKSLQSCPTLCDRILVLCDGKCNGILDARKTNKEEVGLLMTQLKNDQEGGVA